MNMIPFHHIDKPNYLVIQFQSYQNILMLENYCTDPDCDCKEVLLNFAQLNEENKITNNLLNLRIDLETGKVLEKTILEPSMDADAVIYEFHQHFYQFKDHLNENNEKVKDYFSTYQDDQLPRDIIDHVNSGNCVDYHKLFGEINQMTIEYNGETYILEDQYCMKPSCTCDEVIIVVFKPNAMTSEFVFRLDLKKNKHEMLKIHNNKDHMAIINYIVEHKKPILKARYDRMKGLGKRFFKLI